MKNESRLICDICQKKFGSVSTRNRHLRTMHAEKVEKRSSIHIKCPICPEDGKEPLTNHDSLLYHLTEVHSVSVKQLNLNFRNMEEFETWRCLGNKVVDYVQARNVKRPNGEEHVYYNCNRSNSRGFESNCTKRAKKNGGSIKISGVCPSRICARISRSGLVSVKFVETHVGHEEEFRTKRLSKKEQALTVEQSNAGVSNDTCERQKNLICFERRKEILIEEAKNLDRESFEKFIEVFKKFKNKLEQEKNRKLPIQKEKNGEANIIKTNKC